MFDIEHYLNRTHDKNNMDINEEDFKDNNRKLIEYVNEDGILNNVHYNISTGIVDNHEITVELL